MVVAEGEEELGSPHYPEVIDKYEDAAEDGRSAFLPVQRQEPAGDISMFLGVKGILSFELEAKGGAQGGPDEGGDPRLAQGDHRLAGAGG